MKKEKNTSFKSVEPTGDTYVAFTIRREHDADRGGQGSLLINTVGPRGHSGGFGVLEHRGGNI